MFNTKRLLTISIITKSRQLSIARAISSDKAYQISLRLKQGFGLQIIGIFFAMPDSFQLTIFLGDHETLLIVAAGSEST